MSDVVPESVFSRLLARIGRGVQAARRRGVRPFRFALNHLVAWGGPTEKEMVVHRLDYLCDVLEAVPPLVWQG